MFFREPLLCLFDCWSCFTYSRYYFVSIYSTHLCCLLVLFSILCLIYLFEFCLYLSFSLYLYVLFFCSLNEENVAFDANLIALRSFYARSCSYFFFHISIYSSYFLYFSAIFYIPLII